MNVFDEMGIYWAEIADKNQTQRQIQFVKNKIEPNSCVLDLACGSARHMIPLIQQGYDLVGLDISRRLLKIAKLRQPKVQVVRGDMLSLPFKDHAFANAISMDTSFGYLPTEKDDVLGLIELKRVLIEDGVLIIDLFNKTKLVNKYGRISILNRLELKLLSLLLRFKICSLLFHLFSWKEYPSFIMLQKRMISHNGQLLCDYWVIFDKISGQIAVYNHHVRLYAISVFHYLLESTGFNVYNVYGDYEEQAISADSSRLIFQAISPVKI